MRHAIIVAALATMACGSSSSTTPPTAAEVGSYTLLSLDGRSVPTTTVEGASSVDVQSGSLTLDSGGTLRMIVVYRLTGQTAWSTNDLAGRYTRQGSTLSFTFANGGANGATLSGDTIVMVNENVVWTFRRS